MEKKRKAWMQVCFVILSAALLLLFWLVPFIGQKDISETENRSLARLPAFSAAAFLNGGYQDNLENAAGDQLVFSEELRSAVKEIQASLLMAEQDLLCLVNPSLRNGYNQIADGYYIYQHDEHRIIEKPLDYEQNARDISTLPAVTMGAAAS